MPTRSQFEPAVREGDLFGRGAADMKGGIAATAFAIPALAHGPGLLPVSRGPDEFVSIERLLEYAEIHALTAVRMLS